MKKFQEGLKDLTEYYKYKGYESGDEAGEGGMAKVYIVKKDNKILIAKKYNLDYRGDTFIDPYREFLLEFNLESIKPIALYIKKSEDDNDEESHQYYLIMECFKNLSEFFITFKRRYKDDKKKKQLYFDKYLSILLITVSLLQTIAILHVQKIPVLHHDLKPGNVLLSEKKIENGELKNVDIIPGNLDHKLGHFYFAQLIDFGLTKESDSKTLKTGTYLYRPMALYLKETDLFAVAIILKLTLIGFHKSLTDYMNMEYITCKNPNYVYKKYKDHYIRRFYFRDPSNLKGLDIIVNMLLNSYYNRRTIIFDILDILTDKEKLAKIISGDLEGKNIEIDQKELLDKYLEILKLSNIDIKYLPDFEKIAPKIYGKNFKAFLFTMFHQKNNDFKPEAFTAYQEDILKLYDQKKTDQQIDLEIANYHYNFNFFCFEQLFEAFSNKFTNISDNDKSSIYSKLFKILTSLNFKDTRSLNHFTNALHWSLFKVTQEILYNLEMSLGLDYKAKVGFLLSHADKEKYTSKEEVFQLLVDKARFCTELRNPFFETDVENSSSNGSNCDNSNSGTLSYNNNKDVLQLNKVEIKFSIKIQISSYDLITSNFEKFLNIIRHNECLNCKDEYIQLFESMISESDFQINYHNYLQKQYNNDAIFMLFIYYLYYFEIKDEKTRLKSLNGEESLNCNDGDNDSKDVDEPDVDEPDDDESDDDSEEKDKSIVDPIPIPIPEMTRLPIEENELEKLPDDPIISLENPKDNEIFIWLTLYRLGDLIDDVISSDTQEKLQNYIPVIKFLRSLGISILEFHVFLDQLEDTKFDQFRRIAHIFNINNQVNVIASKLQFLESMSYFDENIFNKIVYSIQNGKVTDDFSKFISIEKLGQKTEYYEKVDTSDIRTKINFPYIVYPLGRIEYKTNISKPLSELDPTIKSKIAVCLVHSLNYLTNLPFTLQIYIDKPNIFLDESSDLPFIVLAPFKISDSIDESDSKTDYFNYESLIDELKQIIKLLTSKNDNKFLNIILNYIQITSYGNVQASINHKQNIGNDKLSTYLPFQYIFELFLDETLDFTFRGTDQTKYKQFLDSKIKNRFYTDNQFRKFAYELLGQSYLVKLHYIFTRLKPGSDLTIDRFVNEMNIITETTTLLEFLTNRKVLIDIANLFERYFEEIPFNLVHRLNQLSEPLYKVIDNAHDTDGYLKYNMQEPNDNTISYIYHITNNYVSPMIYSSNGNLYFDVPKTKLTDKINELDEWSQTRRHVFYSSLYSALYYLSHLCEKKYLLPEKLKFDDIYINEKDEAIVPPFRVKEVSKWLDDELFKNIGEDFRFHVNYSIICYSYASYYPIKDDQSLILMRLFGLDYLTELNEFYNSIEGFPSDLTVDNISNIIDEKCKNIKITDKFILDLSSRVNKLSPLFIHLLEKAIQSKNIEISEDAKRRLDIFKSIKEIKDYEKSNEIKKIAKSGESIIEKVKYKGEYVAIKQLKPSNQNFLYLQKMKNMLYLLKIEEDQDEVSKYIVHEIGFTCFGILMDLYQQDLEKYLLKGRCSGFELLTIFLKIIKIISFIHEKKIVHSDIKLCNFLIDKQDDKLNIFLADNLNIQLENALSRVTIETPEFHSKNLKSLMLQDIYAFEVSCYKLFYKTNENDMSFKPFSDYECPMIKFIADNKDYDDDNHVKSIDDYRDKMHQRIYVLPKQSTENEKEGMILAFLDYLFNIGELSENEATFMKIELNTIDGFIECNRTFKKIIKTGSNNYFYMIKFAQKLRNSYKEFEDIEDYKSLLNVFKDEIESNFKAEDNNNNIEMKNEKDELIFELFFLNNFNNIEKEDIKLKLKFRLLQYSKNKFTTQILQDIKYIIKVLDQNQDALVGFFYNFLLSKETSTIEELKKDVELRLNAMNFYYYHNEKTCTSYLQKLILETYDILISNIDKKPIFENWIKCNENTNEFRSNLIFKLPNINIISLCFYTYSQNQIKYKKLNDVFDDEFYTKADELLSQNSSSNNRYITYLREAVKFRKDHGQTLTCIYKKYYLPE